MTRYNDDYIRINSLTYIIMALALFCVSEISSLRTVASRSFPDDFKFGVATSAYQIEGAWNVSDKGESVWDRLVHQQPNLIENHTTGDVTCDSYHQYEKDTEMMKRLGVDFYRFSLSWSRLLPNGFADYVSKDGVDYYNNLINLLLKEGITPMVTLYHWDLPQPLQDLGGWPNPLLTYYFEDYARFVFSTFGDKVKTWITFNEPIEICLGGYGGAGTAPLVNSPGIGEYMCGHTLLLAHSRAYHLYQNEFKQSQNGKIGIAISSDWCEPASSDKDDIEAAERCMQFMMGWFAHPIFSKEGNYPEIMRKRIAMKSQKQKYPRSRLPAFSKYEIAALKGTSDFFGLNHYTTILTKPLKQLSVPDKPSYEDDKGTDDYFDKLWPGSASSWLKVVPWGFRKILNWIRKEYENPVTIVTENGFSTLPGIHDPERTNYLNSYLNALVDALEDGCNVKAYTHWSLMDNFEWLRGFSERFGLYEVDFNSTIRKRTIRQSGLFYSEIIKNRLINKTVQNSPECDEFGETRDIKIELI